MRAKYLSAAMFVAAFTLFMRPAESSAQGWPGSRVNAAAEIGWRSFTRDLTALQPGKFEEYRSTPSGLLLQHLQLDYLLADSSSSFEAVARSVGQSDQNIWLRGGATGLLDVEFLWDRIPHTFSTTARSLGTQPSPDVFTLPSPRPDTSAWNRTSPYLPAIRTGWDAIKVAAAYTPAPHWDTKAEYTRLDKSGQRPVGIAFGSPGANLREVLEPIDQTMHDVRLSQGYSNQRFQVQAVYDLSLFRNAYSSVTSDNPLLTTDSPTGGSARGRIGLAPDNLAHTAVVNSALNLPLRTRANASLSYAWWKQDAPFIPATINSAHTDPRLDSLPASLEGRAGTSSMSLSAVSRPLVPLTISARYRSFSYRDDTELDTMAVRVSNDRSISAGMARHRLPHTRQNADFSLTWRVQQAPVTLSAGYAWDNWKRSQEARNVYRTSEDAPRVSVDLDAFDRLSLRATYSKARRRAKDPYIQNSPADLPEHRRFDQADRDRERLNLLALLVPMDALSLSATYAIGRDAYPHSAYGTQRDHSTMVGGDVIWIAASRFSINAGYTRETFLTRLRSRYRVTGQLDNLTYDWVANTRDRVTTVNAGFTATLVPERLEAGGRYDLSRARFIMATYNPTTPTGGTAAQNLAATATDLPKVTQELQPIAFFLSYQHSPSWGITLRYQVERYDQNDFRTLDLLPAEGNGIFLGNDFPSYNAQFLTVSLTYRPRALGLGRSAL
jgi:MtrB/PioB family decaheme-associated outer membrane protein